MEDKSLEELLSDSFSKKKQQDKSFADLYDSGYEKNDASVNNNREVFDAEKAFQESYAQEKSLLDDFEADAWDQLDDLQKSFGTDDKIQSAANSSLDSQSTLNGQSSAIDTSAARMVSQSSNGGNYQNVNATGANTYSQSPTQQTQQQVLTNSSRPKGHPVNRPAPSSNTAGRTASSGTTGRASSSGSSGRQAASDRQTRVSNNSQSKNKKSKTQKNGGNMGYQSSKDYQKNMGKKAKKKKKKKSKLKRFLLILLLIILLVFGLYSALIFKYAGMLNIVETGDRVSTATDLIDESYVENILVLGTDSRSEESGRSDTMIILSINTKTHQIVQTSLMRDILVDIPGYSSAKLNAAYAYGGAELVMDTIEENFQIKLDHYVEIDFYSFVDIIDALGGLELTVTDDEADAMTDPLKEVNNLLGRDSETIDEGGTYLMDGVQALAYARIRYVGDGDFDRTERQREVIEKVIETFLSSSITDMNSALEVILPEITTNMTKTEIYFMCLKLPFELGYEMREFRIPYGDQDTTWSYGYYGSQSILDIDFEENIELYKKVVIEGEEIDE